MVFARLFPTLRPSCLYPHMSSWLFTLFQPSPAEKLRECQRAVNREKMRLETRRGKEQANIRNAQVLMDRAVRAKKMEQAYQYASQKLAATNAEVQILGMMHQLTEFSRSLERARTIVEMEQVMTTMTQALVQLNTAMSPQRMQRQMMHMEMHHSQLELKHDMIVDAAEGMRDTDMDSVDSSQVDALKIASMDMSHGNAGGGIDRSSTSAPRVSEKETHAGSSSSSSHTDVASDDPELLDLLRQAEAMQSHGDGRTSVKPTTAPLDAASKMVLEAMQSQQVREIQKSMPRVPPHSGGSKVGVAQSSVAYKSTL